MKIGEVSQCAVNDPFHAGHSASIFQLNTKDEMTIAGMRVKSTIRNLHLELLKQNGNTFASVLVALEHAGKYQRSRDTGGQLCQ